MIKKILIIAVCLLVITGCESESDIIVEQDFSEEQSAEVESVKEGSLVEEPEEIYVYICGRVKHPGVYKLASDSRIYDALDAAGGFRKNADREYVNLAEKLSDGQEIYVPSKDETVEMSLTGSGGAQAADAGDGLVNLNTATKDELKSLSGIGDSKADSIIRYREENGAFLHIEDIMNINGIKEATFSKIKDYITV